MTTTPTPTDTHSAPPLRPTFAARDGLDRPYDRDVLAAFLAEKWANDGQVPARPTGLLGVAEALVAATLIEELAGALDPGEPLAALARECALLLETRAKKVGGLV